MSLTSGGMAARNVTQIESLNAKVKVYNIAVFKPPHLSRTNSSDPPYQEISYPFSIVSQDENTEEHQNPAMASPDRPEVDATQSAEEGHSTPSREAASSISPTSSQTATTSQSNSSPVPDPNPNPNPLPQTQTQQLPQPRDNQATRTFAILRTNPGDNPWDLGSYLLNWQAVMGTRVIDWFLPLKRSPCCDHDGMESHFTVGPMVQDLKVAVGFVALEGGGDEQRSRRKRRRRGSR